MRIRNRQVRLPLSLLSPVPLSDLKASFTDPAVLEQQQQQGVQLHQQQPQSSSTQQPAAAEHDDQYFPLLVAPLSSTAHDQSNHHEETGHGDPSDLRQEEGGRWITMEDQKELVTDEEPVDHQVDNHDRDGLRKVRQEILNKNHDLTKCCTCTNTSSKQQDRSDAAAKSSESNSILAADNKLLINPHYSSTSQAGQQMPALGCDGYYSRCYYYYRCQEEEKSIPLKKRRGSSCFYCCTTAAPCIAEPYDHKTDSHQKLEDSDDNTKKNKNMITTRNIKYMKILCKTNEKGNDDLQQEVVNTSSTEPAGIRKMSAGTISHTAGAAATVGAVAGKTRDKKRGGGSTSSGAYNVMDQGGGSRCSRVNGRSWRCNQPTLVGYSLCQHHLGQGRRPQLRTTSKQPLKKEIKTMKKKQLSESFAPAAIPMPSSSSSSSSDIMRVKSAVKSRSLSSLLARPDR